MAKTILNFHFDYLNPSLTSFPCDSQQQCKCDQIGCNQLAISQTNPPPRKLRLRNTKRSGTATLSDKGNTKHGTNLYGFTSLAVKKETVSRAHLNCFTTSLGRWYGPDKAIYRLNWSDEVCCLRFESLGTCGLFHKRIFRLGQL